MDTMQYFIYLVIIAGSTYLVRMIPFVLARRKIENVFIRSFLYYIPYAVLTAMTIPAVFTSTGSIYSAVFGVIVAIILAYKGKSLTVVAVFSCVAVFICDLFITYVIR